VAIGILKQIMADNPAFSYTEIDVLNHPFGQVFPYLICAFFAVQALYLLGSVYFARYSFVLTSVIAALMFFCFVYYAGKLEDILFDKEIGWDLITASRPNVNDKSTYLLYSLPSTLSQAIKYFSMFAGAPILWLATWYRLKEKEI
jgi:hypothetical protein